MFSRLAAKLRESAHPPFRLRGGRRGPGCQRRAAAVPRGARGGPAEQPVLRRRPGPADLSAAVLLESAGRRCSRAVATLRINYRTSHQIRTQADRLLGPEVSDVDGNTEERKGTISVFNGPPPDDHGSGYAEEEIKAVGQWLAERAKEGIVPHEIGVFVRSAAELDRARAAVEGAGLPFKVLDENVETTSGHVSISTMHLAKGLEFRAVVVMACDDEVIPSAGADRDGRGRRRSRRGLQHRTASALCCLHPRAGSSAGDERRAGVGVPGRSAEVRIAASGPDACPRSDWICSSSPPAALPTQALGAHCGRIIFPVKLACRLSLNGNMR